MDRNKRSRYGKEEKIQNLPTTLKETVSKKEIVSAAKKKSFLDIISCR